MFRRKCRQIKIALYDQPTDKGLLDVNHSGDSSPELYKWLPARQQNTKCFSTETLFSLKKVWSENRYSLGTELPPEQAKRNPIIEAKKLQALKADNPRLHNALIAKRLGISRPRVTQMLKLLTLPAEIQEYVEKNDKFYSERLLQRTLPLQNRRKAARILKENVIGCHILAICNQAIAPKIESLECHRFCRRLEFISACPRNYYSESEVLLFLSSANFVVIVGFPLVSFLTLKSSALLLAMRRLFSEPISASLVF